MLLLVVCYQQNTTYVEINSEEGKDNSPAHIFTK